MFHKEGYFSIIANTIAVAVLNGIIWLLLPSVFALQIGLTVGSLLFLIIILQFFRNPNRRLERTDASIVYAPADGKVVVIEEADEPEYFKDRRLQVSIFMSPLNVHVNRNPVSGKILFAKHHKGKYLAAWNPKASTENERTTIVYETEAGQQILMRQVAGALAKRICHYVKDGDSVVQGEDMGFIKLGSRVDLYFPLGTKIEVKLGQVSVGNRTIIARW
jgi:phosphatidylserine decarboxylase